MHPLDELVGLDLTPTRRNHLLDQICGSPLRPIVPAGLAPFMTLPRPEAFTLVRARMAALLSSVMAANGQVTRDDLEQAGFDGDQIARHFTEAKRIAGLHRMVA